MTYVTVSKAIGKADLVVQRSSFRRRLHPSIHLTTTTLSQIQASDIGSQTSRVCFAAINPGRSHATCCSIDQGRVMARVSTTSDQLRLGLEPSLSNSR